MTKIIPLAALFPLRALALSTDDPLTAQIVLQFLGETEGEAMEMIAGSCWGEDLEVGREREGLRAALLE